MSILVTIGLIILAIVLLAVNLTYITLALYRLGISNLFKTIEDVFTGKNKGATGEDYLIYAGIISSSVFMVIATVIFIVIILAVFGGSALVVGAGTGVDEAALAAGGAAEGAAVAAEGAEGAAVAAEGAEGAAAEGGSSFFSKIGNMLSGWFGTVLLIVLIAIVFASTSSGVLCILSAYEIKKEKDFNKDKKLRQAYTDAIIAGIVGIAIAVFAILALIAYFVYKYYKKREEKLREEQAEKRAEKIEQDIQKGKEELFGGEKGKELARELIEKKELG